MRSIHKFSITLVLTIALLTGSLSMSSLHSVNAFSIDFSGIHGFDGNSGLNILKGLQGPLGLTGATGPQGPPGFNGTQGPQGLTGNTGPQGIQGPLGLTGATGPQGPPGFNGTQGPQGIQGIQGPSGPGIEFGNLTVIVHTIDESFRGYQSANFTVHITGNQQSPDTFPGSETGTQVKIGFGSYTVTETPPITTLSITYSQDCSGVIHPNETKTCTISNYISPIP
jgi:hypothetical protein